MSVDFEPKEGIVITIGSRGEPVAFDSPLVEMARETVIGCPGKIIIVILDSGLSGKRPIQINPSLLNNN